MDIDLKLQPTEMVRARVASGMDTSASEVVREALRLMKEQDRLRAVKLERLRSDIRKGLESGPSEDWDAHEVKRQPRGLRSFPFGRYVTCHWPVRERIDVMRVLHATRDIDIRFSG